MFSPDKESGAAIPEDQQRLYAISPEEFFSVARLSALGVGRSMATRISHAITMANLDTELKRKHGTLAEFLTSLRGKVESSKFLCVNNLGKKSAQVIGDVFERSGLPFDRSALRPPDKPYDYSRLGRKSIDEAVTEEDWNTVLAHKFSQEQLRILMAVKIAGAGGYWVGNEADSVKAHGLINGINKILKNEDVPLGLIRKWRKWNETMYDTVVCLKHVVSKARRFPDK